VDVRVLVVEDDPATRDLLERGLREEWFRVHAVADGPAAEHCMVEMGGFDAIVLDVMLPGHDGFALCRRARARGVDTPILLLTGRHGLDDRVRGLDAGADDYLAKPFAFEELFARLRALLRRGRTRNRTAVLSYGQIELDPRDRVVRVKGASVLMTATEFRLLEFLLRRAERVVTREEIVQYVWGDGIGGDSNVVDVYISYVRKKLRPAGHLVRTIRRVGYTIKEGDA
jgi:two-component system OmpR family response regulator